MARRVEVVEELLHEARSVPPPTTLERALPVLLDRGMWLLGADLGAVQVLDGATGALRLVAHAGFDDDFVDRYAVDADPVFARYRSVATRYGFRAGGSPPPPPSNASWSSSGPAMLDGDGSEEDGGPGVRGTGPARP